MSHPIQNGFMIYLTFCGLLISFLNRLKSLNKIFPYNYFKMKFSQVSIKSENKDCSFDNKIELHQKKIYLLSKIIQGNKSKMDWFELYFKTSSDIDFDYIDIFLDAHLKLEKQNEFFVQMAYESGLFLIEDNKKRPSNFLEKLKNSIKSVFHFLFKHFKK